MPTAWLAPALAICSRATTYATAPAPLPPHRSGITMPMSPSSPMPLTVSCGKRQSRSISAAIGLIWASANSRTVAWIICCSPVNSSRMSLGLFLQELLELFRELGYDLAEVGDEAEVGDLEDRRLRVLVHRDDDFRRSHPGQMLDRARDAEAQVELGRDGPAGLSDLEPVRPPAGVDGGAGRAHRGADHTPQLLEDHVILGPLHPTAARDDRLRFGQLGEPRRDFLAPLYELHLGGGGHHRGTLDRRGLSGLRFGGTEHVGPERRDPRRLRPRHLREKLARVDRARRDERVALEREADRIGGEAHAEPRGEPRHKLALATRHGREDRLRRLLGRELGGGGHPHFAPVRSERRVLEEQHSRGAPLGELLQAGLARLVGEPHGLGPPGRQPRGFADDLGHDLLRRAVSIVLDEAPEPVRHCSLFPFAKWLWRPRAGRGRAPSPRWARRPG